jgi:hypothetical protein
LERLLPPLRSCSGPSSTLPNPPPKQLPSNSQGFLAGIHRPIWRMKYRKELKPQQLERSLHSEVYRRLALACTVPCVRYPIFFGPLESTMPSHAKTLLRRLISFDLKVYSSPTAMSARLPASQVSLLLRCYLPCSSTSSERALPRSKNSFYSQSQPR